MLELKRGDVIWSGKAGGSFNSPYHIEIDSIREIQSSNSGCWCPAEAVEFFQFLGINAAPDTIYSSGFTANGCYWNVGESTMSPHIQQAYDEFIGMSGNKRHVNKLERYDD